MRCVLVGNYGAGNVGDEALRAYFLQTFPDIQWTVITVETRESRVSTGGPAQVPRLPCGFQSLLMSWWKTVRAMWRADAVVFGGGSLFTDTESVFACVLWWWHGFVAWLLGRPLVLAFQGVGPLRTWLGQRLARFIVERAAFISVRDPASLERIQTWKLKCKPVLSFDPAFALFAQSASVDHAEPNHSILTLIPRTNSGPPFIHAVTTLLEHRQFERCQIILMQPSRTEHAFARTLASVTRLPTDVVAAMTVPQLRMSIGRSTIVLSERYHGALAAFALGIETVICAQLPGDKLSELKAIISRGESGRHELLELVERGRGALQEYLHWAER